MNTKRQFRFASLGLLSLMLLSYSASAQVPRDTSTQRLPSLDASLAATDDSRALALNPANLGFMPSSELRWSAIFLNDELMVPWQGHAFSFATPLPFGLSTGLRVDLVDPPDSASRSQNYQYVTWGLALSNHESFSVGFSLQRSYSDSPLRDDLGSYSLAMSSRPSPIIGFSAVANDLNGPTNSFGARRSPSYDIGVALRPTGERQIELGLEAKYLLDADDWVPRASLGFDIGPIGRLSASFSARDFDKDEVNYIASASLSVYTTNPAGSVEFSGGAVGGNSLGRETEFGNPHLNVALRGFREQSGMELPYSVRIRLEGTPSPRQHVSLLRRLWALAKDDSVDAVLLELRSEPAGSFAHAQELRDALHLLRNSGKRVLCHLEDNRGTSLYVCAAASRTLINPAGGVRFAGLRSQSMYFGKLLQNIGIRADFVRIGAHKSAPESFSRSGASEVARADRIDLLQQLERQFVEGIASGRRLSPADVRKGIASGPHIAAEAQTARFVDGSAYDDELSESLNSLLGYRTLLVDEDIIAPRAKKQFSREQSIAVVYVDGDMVDGRSSQIPFLGMKLAGSYTIAESLKEASEDPRIGAIVLRVETPGGSAMAAEVIWRQVALAAKQKPVVVSMGNYAASAGYYISAAGKRIFANPASITGSIGVFYGKADVAGLLGKIGVDIETYKTAPRADAESLYRPFTAEERVELERKVGQFYGTFLDRVAKGRPLSKEQIDQVAQGRVWTGEQALKHRLVDELGGLRQALEYARQQAGLSDRSPIVELPRIETSLIGQLLGVEGLVGGQAISLPSQVSGVIRGLGPFLVYDSNQPLMRLEFAPLSP